MDFNGADLKRFFSDSKLDGHWINAAIMSRPRTPSVSGGEWRSGLAWAPGFCVMIGGSVERLHLLLIDSDFCTIKSR